MLTALLVTSAATLLSSAPFILAAAALGHLPLRWNARLVAYLGCGCGAGPSARSLPAAAATCLVFGPLVAGARLAAAFTVDRLQKHRHACAHAHAAVLGELHVLTPVAAIGASIALLLPAIAGAHPSRIAAFALAALAGFLSAPCALGTVGLAAALRTFSWAAAAGFLCVAGIFDLRAWLPRTHGHTTHDPLAYAIAATACALAGVRGGAGLVHPKIALALVPCACAFAYLAFRFRAERCARIRIAPAIMLAGTILAAPPPQYHATETTLADAFAGERIDFTGVITRTGSTVALVRYAITCCRADAAPVVIRLASPLHALHGWAHARGVLVERDGTLALAAQSVVEVPPPADPFVYR